MKWIKLFETFVYEDITSTPKNAPKLNIVKKLRPDHEITPEQKKTSSTTILSIS